MAVVKDYSKNLTITETYSTANVQEIVEKSLQDYFIEHIPPQPEQESIDPSIQQNGVANSITATNLQAMVKTYLDVTNNDGGNNHSGFTGTGK